LFRPEAPSSANFVAVENSVDAIVSVEVLELAVATITHKGFPLVVGIVCVHDPGVPPDRTPVANV